MHKHVTLVVGYDGELVPPWQHGREGRDTVLGTWARELAERTEVRDRLSGRLVASPDRDRSSPRQGLVDDEVLVRHDGDHVALAGRTLTPRPLLAPLRTERESVTAGEGGDLVRAVSVRLPREEVKVVRESHSSTGDGVAVRVDQPAADRSPVDELFVHSGVRSGGDRDRVGVLRDQLLVEVLVEPALQGVLDNVRTGEELDAVETIGVRTRETEQPGRALNRHLGVRDGLPLSVK